MTKSTYAHTHKNTIIILKNFSFNLESPLAVSIDTMKYMITQQRTMSNDFRFSISIEKGISEEKRIDAKIVCD